MTIDEEISARSRVFMSSSRDPRVTREVTTEKEAVEALEFLAAMFGLIAKKNKAKEGLASELSGQ